MSTSILKRTILFCTCIFAGFLAQAQFSISPKVGFGLTGGNLNVAPAAGTGTGGNIKTNAVANLNVSIGAEVAYQFDDFWAINSGAFYQYLSPKFNQQVYGSPSSIIQDKISYLNIPLEIVHTNKNLSKGFYYGVGVNFGLPVSGSETRTTADGAASVNTTIKFDGGQYHGSDATNSTHLNFLNTGLTGKAGYFFGNIFIGVDGKIGLTNLISSNNNNNKSSYKLDTYGIHIGYTFGRKVPVAIKPTIEQ